MILYLKCIWWNKVLLLGYVIILIGFGVMIVDFGSGCMTFSFGINVLSLCHFGQHTQAVYKRSLHLFECGKNPEDKINMFWYCSRCGYRWAKYEYLKK